MSATKITFTVLALSLLAVGPAAAEPMTLAKCIDVALHGNPDITSANLEVEATTAQRKSARGAFGPRRAHPGEHGKKRGQRAALPHLELRWQHRPRTLGLAQARIRHLHVGSLSVTD